MTSLLRRHPLAGYFALSFVLSWGAVLAVIAGGAVPAPPSEAERLFPFVYLAMLVGPSVAGVVMTAVVGGRDGLRALGRRLLTWRVGGRWYAVALFTAPVVLIATVAALSRHSAAFVPAVLGGTTGALGPLRGGNLPLLALLVGLGAGFFEELGWTGFAIPTMRARRSVLVTGLVVGVFWGAWHFLAVFWGSASAFGTASVPLFMVVALFAFLPPYRVLIARVYDRTQSLLVAVMMHASLTTSMILLGPVVTGTATIAYDLAFGAALWAVVAITGARRRLTEIAEPVAADPCNLVGRAPDPRIATPADTAVSRLSRGRPARR